MIFDTTNDRLGHERETKLIVAARPIPTALRSVIHKPADSAGHKLWRDFVTVGISKNAEQVTRLKRKLETRRIQRFNLCAFKAAAENGLSEERHPQNSRAKKIKGPS